MMNVFPFAAEEGEDAPFEEEDAPFEEEEEEDEAPFIGE